MNPAATLSATNRFALIIKGLCDAVAARIAARTITATLITLIWTRLHRIEASLKSLAAGTLRVGHSGPRHFAGRKPTQSPLPRGFGWLLPLVPQHAPAAASQLRHLLADPEMAGLIAATPRMARTLHPLCHMLGLPRDLLPPEPSRPSPQPAAIVPKSQQNPPPPAEPREAEPPPPPPDNPQVSARAGPASFPWPWLLPDQS